MVNYPIFIQFILRHFCLTKAIVFKAYFNHYKIVGSFLACAAPRHCNHKWSIRYYKTAVHNMSKILMVSWLLNVHMKLCNGLFSYYRVWRTFIAKPPEKLSKQQLAFSNLQLLGVNKGINYNAKVKVQQKLTTLL